MANSIILRLSGRGEYIQQAQREALAERACDSETGIIASKREFLNFYDLLLSCKDYILGMLFCNLYTVNFQ